MAFIPVPHAVRISFEFEFAGQTVVFTISLGKSTSWSASDIDNTLTDMKNWYDDNIKGIVSDSLALGAINGVDQESASGPSRTLTAGMPIVGTKTGGALPTNAAVVCSFSTGLRGRSFRGRAYLPGIDATDTVDETTVTTPLAAAIAPAFSVINSYMTTAGAAHVIISRFAGGFARTTGIFTPVTGYRCDTAIDSMRTRLLGRGN